MTRASTRIFGAVMIGGFVAGVGLAQADEVIIERHREVPVEVVPPPPSDVVIERRRPDCTTSRTHTEDDTGASSTVTRRDCD